MDEILVVWGLDGLCHLPGDQIEKAAQVAGERGLAFHRSSAEGVLLVNSPFAGRQVALIVEAGEEGAALSLGGALQELLVAASARVNLVRLAGRPAALPLGGHLLLWLAEGAGQAPLVIVPGKYYGSARLASLINEELSSAARLTPGTEVLFLQTPRGPCPSSIPAVRIECPPGDPGAVQHWAAGLKQGLARHFSGEGTSLSAGGPAAAGESPEGAREEAVRVFWRRLKEAVPQARLTAAAKTVFDLEDDCTPLPPAAPAPPVQTVAAKGSPHQTGMRAARASQILGRPAGAAPPSFGLRPSPVAVARLPEPGFRYPPSPYPVSMAPFPRPAAAVPAGQETKVFPRPLPGPIVPAGDGAGGTRFSGPGAPSPPASPLR